MSDVSEQDAVTYEREGQVATITYNRPEALNAVDGRLRRDLNEAWQRFLDDEEAWVGILTGAGDRAFCVGADMKRPEGAVGTFGGEVVSIDATDDGKGKFRILVRPDLTDRPWPNERFLRQGVRANGWVILDQVPLWYEIWRNMNGFPPVVSTEEPKDDSKPPKLPKP